jgi:hypothetical protein
VAGAAALGTARGSFLRRWRLLAIDGFQIDMPDSTANAAAFGYAGSGDNRSAFPSARVVAVAECACTPSWPPRSTPPAWEKDPSRSGGGLIQNDTGAMITEVPDNFIAW